MHAMNDNETNILKLPYKIEDWDAPMSDEQLAYQTKLVFTRMLNMASEGKYTLTEKDKRDISWYNEVVSRCGYDPIDCDLTRY